MSSRRGFLALSAAAPLLAARAAGAQTASPGLLPITVQTNTPVDVVTLFYGVNQKLFEKAGLDVTIQVVGGGAFALASVIGGAAQFGFSNPLSIVTAYAKGAPVQFVAPGSQLVPAAPTAQLFVLPDSPIQTAKDCEDHTVATTGLHDLLALSVRTWADTNGADSTKIRFIELSPPTTIPALQAKRVDVAAVFEPYRSNAANLGMRAIGAPYGSIAKEFLTGTWFGNRDWIAAHKDAAKRFADVIRVAGDYANNHWDELVPFIASYTKIDPDVIAHANRPHFPPAISPPMIQPLINAAVKYKEIPQTFDAKDVIFHS